MTALTFAMFALLVLVTHVIGGVAGFGGTLLGLAAVTWVGVALPTAAPALLLAGSVQSVYVLAVRRAHVARGPLGRMLLLAAAGVPLGVLAAARLDRQMLTIVFALVSVASGLTHFAPKPRGGARARRVVADWLLVAAGALHGAFAAGGAPAVVAARVLVPEKQAFRATMFGFWVVLNAVVIAAYLSAGRYDRPVMTLTAVAIPAVVIAMLLAERVAARLSQAAFARFVAALLVLAGGLTLVRAVWDG
ncbi:MAG TPA: sulfite exporter TauE/SafE family protein [Tepidisphaeraceae bacterium]|nr:sulfite exporter TauE/SafE family protein [Tepidisphaeraceae bacterium]